jgi:hypothetical protein
MEMAGKLEKEVPRELLERMVSLEKALRQATTEIATRLESVEASLDALPPRVKRRIRWCRQESGEAGNLQPGEAKKPGR